MQRFRQKVERIKDQRRIGYILAAAQRQVSTQYVPTEVGDFIMAPALILNPTEIFAAGSRVSVGPETLDISPLVHTPNGTTILSAPHIENGAEIFSGSANVTLNVGLITQANQAFSFHINQALISPHISQPVILYTPDAGITLDAPLLSSDHEIFEPSVSQVLQSPLVENSYGIFATSPVYTYYVDTVQQSNEVLVPEWFYTSLDLVAQANEIFTPALQVDLESALVAQSYEIFEAGTEVELAADLITQPNEVYPIEAVMGYSAALIEQPHEVFVPDLTVTLEVPLIEQPHEVLDATADPIWTAEDISSALWYDASSDDNMTLDGANITGMTDLSGNGLHGTKQGAGVLTKGSINGVQSVQHPAQAATPARIRAPLSGTSAKYVIAVADDSADENNTWMLAQYSTSLYIGVAQSGGTTPLSAGVTGENYRSNGTAFGGTTRDQLLQAWQDGAVIAAKWTSLNAGWVHWDLFWYETNTWWFNGTWGEIIFLDAVPDTDTEQRLEGYLAHKWGYAHKLPEAHPYRYLPPTKKVLEAPLIEQPYEVLEHTLLTEHDFALIEQPHEVLAASLEVELNVPLIEQPHEVFEAEAVVEGARTPEVIYFHDQVMDYDNEDTSVFNIPVPEASVGDLFIVIAMETAGISYSDEFGVPGLKRLTSTQEGYASVLVRIIDGTEGANFVVDYFSPYFNVLAVHSYLVSATSWSGNIGDLVAIAEVFDVAPEVYTAHGEVEHLYLYAATAVYGTFTSNPSGLTDVEETVAPDGVMRSGRFESVSDVFEPESYGTSGAYFSVRTVLGILGAGTKDPLVPELSPGVKSSLTTVLNTDGEDFVIPLPAGIEEDDFIVVVIGANGGLNYLAGVPPSGYSAVSGDSGSNADIRVFIKRSSGTEDPTIVLDTSSYPEWWDWDDYAPVAKVFVIEAGPDTMNGGFAYHQTSSGKISIGALSTSNLNTPIGSTGNEIVWFVLVSGIDGGAPGTFGLRFPEFSANKWLYNTEEIRTPVSSGDAVFITGTRKLPLEDGPETILGTGASSSLTAIRFLIYYAEEA